MNRHVHVGKLRKTVNGTLFVSVAESGDKVFVSESGRIITPRRKDGEYRGCAWDSGFGMYMTVNIAGVPALVHRVVVEVFTGEIPNGMEVDHIDTVGTNNDLANLKVVTSSQHKRNPITRARTLKALSSSIKIAVEASKKRIIAIDELGRETMFNSAADAERATGVSRKAIWCALNGKSKTSGGLKWRYK